MGALENECQIPQNDILHKNFQNFICVFTILVRFDIYFLGLQWEIVLEKCKKECDIVSIILVQGFCPLKIKITLFPDGFRLKSP